MDRREARDFFQKWKSNYPYAKLDELRIEQIYGDIKEYSSADINRKFDEHLANSQYGSREPNVKFLIKFLKKENDFKNIHDIKVQCKYCLEAIPLDEYSNHIARHNSVYYIKKNEHLINKNFNESNMMQLEQSKFEKIYDEFLNQIKSRIENDQERKLVNNIVNHNSNMVVQEFLNL